MKLNDIQKCYALMQLMSIARGVVGYHGAM